MKCSAELREEEARSILGSFLFRRLAVEKRVSVLSGGEKSRLSLVKFLVDQMCIRDSRSGGTLEKSTTLTRGCSVSCPKKEL